MPNSILHTTNETHRELSELLPTHLRTVAPELKIKATGNRRGDDGIACEAKLGKGVVPPPP